MLKRLLLKFVKYYLPILILSVLAVLWLYKKEHKNLISLQQDELSNKKQLIVELLKPMIANLYYWEQYHFSENDFNPDKNAHLDKEIGDFLLEWTVIVNLGLLIYQERKYIDLMDREMAK